MLSQFTDFLVPSFIEVETFDTEIGDNWSSSLQCETFSWNYFVEALYKNQGTECC